MGMEQPGHTLAFLWDTSVAGYVTTPAPASFSGERIGAPLLICRIIYLRIKYGLRRYTEVPS